jgi:hypothetical protein
LLLLSQTLIICQESGNNLDANRTHVRILVHILWQYLLVNIVTDPNGVCELMDYSVSVFVDEFSFFYQNFIFFYLCFSALNVLHLRRSAGLEM